MRLEALQRRGSHVSIEIECDGEAEAMNVFEQVLALLESGLIDVDVGEAR